VSTRVLVAGIGNVFLGDDGFGVEVARRLAEIELPEWVAVGDYGISGMHLAYDLADGVETAILVDAMPRGGEPGTIYVVDGLAEASETVEASGAVGLDGAGGADGISEVSETAEVGASGVVESGATEVRGASVSGAAEASGTAEAGGADGAFFDGHGMQPDVVLGMLGTLGAEVGQVLIVGCEPASVDYGMELSAPVAAAVDNAVRVVLELIAADGGGAGREGSGETLTPADGGGGAGPEAKGTSA